METPWNAGLQAQQNAYSQLWKVLRDASLRNIHTYSWDFFTEYVNQFTYTNKEGFFGTSANKNVELAAEAWLLHFYENRTLRMWYFADLQLVRRDYKWISIWRKCRIVCYTLILDSFGWIFQNSRKDRIGRFFVDALSFVHDLSKPRLQLVYSSEIWPMS